MSELTPAQAYEKYLALKWHFTTEKYDYFKYQGKIKKNILDTLESKPYKYSFFKLAKKDNVEGFLISNMLSNPNVWIGELVNNKKYTEIYENWKKRKESLTYEFTKDLEQLDPDLYTNLKVVDGEHPILLKLILREKISLETFTIITHLCNISNYWNKQIKDKIIYPSIKLKVQKYYKFITYDTAKFKKIILEKFYE